MRAVCAQSNAKYPRHFDDDVPNSTSCTPNTGHRNAILKDRPQASGGLVNGFDFSGKSMGLSRFKTAPPPLS